MTKEEQLYREYKEQNKIVQIPYCKGGIGWQDGCKNCVWYDRAFLSPERCLMRPIGNPYAVACTTTDCESCDITFCPFHGKKFPDTEEAKEAIYEEFKKKRLSRYE